MNKEPASSVDILSRIVFSIVSFTLLNVFEIDFTRREQIDSWYGFITYGHETFGGVDIDTGEVVEVIEDCSVGSSQSEFNLGQLRKHSEESHLMLCHHHAFEVS